MDFDDRVRRVIAEQHDEIAVLRDENERLRKLVEDLYSEAYFEDSDRIEYRYLGEMRELGLKTVSWS